MEQFIRLSLKMLLNPLSLILFILTFSIVRLWIKGNDRLVRIGLTISLVALWLVSTGWFPYHTLYTLEHQYAIVDKVNPDIHWVVVLGGGQFEHTLAPANHILKAPSMIRLIEGVRLYRLLPHAKLLLSGGSQENRVDSEAAHMAVLSAWFNIPLSDVVLEIQSKNTMDEALYIKQWIKHEPFYLVTSASHMKRAIGLFKQQGFSPIAAPSDYLFQKEEGRWQKAIMPNPHNIVDSSIVFYETLGKWWASCLHVKKLSSS